MGVDVGLPKSSLDPLLTLISIRCGPGKFLALLIFFDNSFKSFIEIVPKIISRNIKKKWTKNDKRKQEIKRGRYAEFNLLYDRGTKFGLETDGNIDAILMSMPPKAIWK